MSDTMADVKHTLGPWHISEVFLQYGFTDNDGCIPIMGGIGDNLKRVASALLTRHVPRGKTFCATDPERDANVHLIAAAPDLLKACEFALDLPALIAEYRSQPENSTGAGGEIDTVLAAIRAAISRATTPHQSERTET